MDLSRPYSDVAPRIYNITDYELTHEIVTERQLSPHELEAKEIRIAEEHNNHPMRRHARAFGQEN